MLEFHKSCTGLALVKNVKLSVSLLAIQLAKTWHLNSTNVPLSMQKTPRGIGVEKK